MRLIARSAEKQALHELLDSVRAGMSRVLALQGEPGIGKSALLEYAVEHASDLLVLRTAAVESEQSLGFAGVHQLLLPVHDEIDRLPVPQRRALGVAFGLVSEEPADRFLVGLAVLTLLSDAAEDQPVLCVVDDAQWLDQESADILGFVARRLLADRVGMLFGVRDTMEPMGHLRALPGLHISGLSPGDAHELLATSVGRPVSAEVAERIVAVAGGNPLAVVEATRALTPEQLGGRAPLPDPLPVGHRLEDLFAQRAQELPADTQTLLLMAAANHSSRDATLWEAADALAIPASAALPAETSGLVALRPEVCFSHPLVRSAIYHSATAGQRRRVHRALAGACDPELDADARAWHLADAAAGTDERAAAEQEAAAVRAGDRGGYAAAAGLLERAALLTPRPERRAERRLAAAEVHLLAGSVDRARALLADARPDLHDPRSHAEATRLEGRIQLARGHVSEAASALVDAAGRLGPLDPGAARDTLLTALEATVFAGWAANAPLLERIVQTARDLPATADAPDSPINLLLDGCIARVTGGHEAAVPALRRAIEAFLAEELPLDAALQGLELISIMAVDLLDDAAVDRLTKEWEARARECGALAKLAAVLAFRSAFVDGTSGRLVAARAAQSEAHDLAETTHNPGVVPPTGAHTLLTLALSGREAQARETAAAVAREAPSRGAVGEMAMASSFLGVLEISLGNYGAAVGCLSQAFTDDTPLIGTSALPDLVEAAVRADRRDLAELALQRLEVRAAAARTPLALGLLACSRAQLAAPEDAGRKYEEAIDLLGRTGSAPQLARVHLLHGEWLRRQRRRREAREQLKRAQDMFDAMGMDAFAERAAMELRATGERARKRETGAPERLTPQEAQIAALVSRGEANRDIAAQLFISPSTVEYHLRKVFRKLGMTSRTQLARYVVEQSGDVRGLIPVPRRPVLAERS